jgi:hypothetical protein
MTILQAADMFRASEARVLTEFHKALTQVIRVTIINSLPQVAISTKTVHLTPSQGISTSTIMSLELVQETTTAISQAIRHLPPLILQHQLTITMFLPLHSIMEKELLLYLQSSKINSRPAKGDRE